MGIIRLPQPGEAVKPGSVCGVAGWGQTNVTFGESSNVLLEIDLEVLGDTICEDHYNCYYDPRTMLCVGDFKGNKSSFQVSLWLVPRKGTVLRPAQPTGVR